MADADVLAILSPHTALPGSSAARRRLCLLACGEEWPAMRVRNTFASCALEDKATLLRSIAKAQLVRSGAVGAALLAAVASQAVDAIKILAPHAREEEMAMAASRAGAINAANAAQALLDGAPQLREAILCACLESAAQSGHAVLAHTCSLALALETDPVPLASATRALEWACIEGHTDVCRHLLRVFPALSQSARMQGAKLATARGHGDLARLILTAPDSEQVVVSLSRSLVDLTLPKAGPDEILRPTALVRMASSGGQIPQALARAVSLGDSRGAQALALVSSETDVKDALVLAADKGDAGLVNVMARQMTRARSPELPPALSRALDVAARNGNEYLLARLLASKPKGDGQTAVELAIAGSHQGCLDLLLGTLPPRTDAQLSVCLKRCAETGDVECANVVAKHADSAKVIAVSREILMSGARSGDAQAVTVAALLLGFAAKGTGHAAMLEAELRGHDSVVQALKQTLMLHRQESTPTTAARGLLSLDDTMLGYTLEFLSCTDLCSANQVCQRLWKRTRLQQQTETCLVQDYLAVRTSRRGDAPVALTRLAMVVSPPALAPREVLFKTNALMRILAEASHQNWPDQGTMAVQLCATAARTDNARVLQSLLEHRLADEEFAVLPPAAHLLFGVVVDNQSMACLGVMLRVCLVDGRLGTRPLVPRVRAAAGHGQSGLVAILLAALSREATASRRMLIEQAHRRREEWVRRGGLIMPGAVFDDGLANKSPQEVDQDDAFAGAIVHASEGGQLSVLTSVFALLTARGRLGDFENALCNALEAAARMNRDNVILFLLKQCRPFIGDDRVNSALLFAARNGFVAAASAIITAGGVSASDVAYSFVDCVRRGWLNAVKCLLATGAVGAAPVEVALEEALRRGSEDLCTVLLDAKAKLAELEGGGAPEPADEEGSAS